MKCEQLIRAIEVGAAENMASAAQFECAAVESLADGLHSFAAEEVARAERLRWAAGCGLAAINHINGVSPE